MSCQTLARLDEIRNLALPEQETRLQHVSRIASDRKGSSLLDTTPTTPITYRHATDNFRNRGAFRVETGPDGATWE